MNKELRCTKCDGELKDMDKTNSLKLRIFEIISKATHPAYFEDSLRTIANNAVKDYDYDKAVETYEVIKEWNSLKREESE